MRLKDRDMNWYKNLVKISGNEIDQNPEGKNTFEIRLDLIPELEKKLKPLQNKAEKLGLQPISFNVSEPFVKKVMMDDGSIEQEVAMEFVNVTIVGNFPILAGWEFVVRLTHLPDPNNPGGYNNIVNPPNAVYPDFYKTAPPWCEHCNVLRNRISTVILKNTASGEYKQVASTCLKDFVSTEQNIVSYIESVLKFLSSAETSSKTSGETLDVSRMGGYKGYLIDTLSALEVASALIREKGFTSGRAAYENPGLTSTAALIRDYFFDDIKHRMSLKVSEEDKKTAQEAIEWIQAKKDEPGATDFIWNLSVITSNPYTNWKSLGYLAALIPSMMKERGQKQKWQIDKEENAKSDYVGNIGDKILSKMVFQGATSFEGTYGTTHVNKFVDASGNKYTWFSSSRPVTEDTTEGTPKGYTGSLKEGEEIYLFGTIKDHKEYKGVKSTLITRCKVVPENKLEAYKKKATLSLI